jgi:hypothetical protein
MYQPPRTRCPRCPLWPLPLLLARLKGATVLGIASTSSVAGLATLMPTAGFLSSHAIAHRSSDHLPGATPLQVSIPFSALLISSILMITAIRLLKQPSGARYHDKVGGIDGSDVWKYCAGYSGLRA